MCTSAHVRVLLMFPELPYVDILNLHYKKTNCYVKSTRKFLVVDISEISVLSILANRAKAEVSGETRNRDFFGFNDRSSTTRSTFEHPMTAAEFPSLRKHRLTSTGISRVSRLHTFVLHPPSVSLPAARPHRRRFKTFASALLPALSQLSLIHI